MTASQVLLYLLITGIILIVVRAFWVEIALIVVLCYLLGQLIMLSLFSAILWAVFVTGSAAGWGWTFLYFLGAYCMASFVYYLIIKDVFSMVGQAIVSFFKKIK